MTVADLVRRLDAKKSGKGWKAKCPAHDDDRPSLSISEGHNGCILINCLAGCSLDEILAALGLTKRDLFPDSMRLPAAAASAQTNPASAKKIAAKFNWQACVAAMTDEHIEQIARERGYSISFVRELREKGRVGIYKRLVAFPVENNNREIVGAHVRKQNKKDWFHTPSGTKAAPLVFGEIGDAPDVFESTWDGLDYMDKTGKRDGIIIARSASNAKQVAALLRECATCTLWPQNDKANAEFQAMLLANTQCAIRRVNIPAHHDLNDWTRDGAMQNDLIAASRNAETLQRSDETSVDITGESERESESVNAEDETIRRLAEMSLLEYEKVRLDEAKKLKFRPSILDKLVQAQRVSMRPQSESDNLQGEIVVLTDVELWPEPVSGAEILDAITKRFAHYVVLSQGAADMLALWCAHTHMFNAFQISPRVDVSAPTQECGKTTLRDCAAQFCARAKCTDSMTTAVMFRLVSGHRPTILADECDKWAFKNEELVGLFNSGHRKGGTVMRCEGESNELREFGCYAPVLFAAIGSLPSQLHSRSIVIRLERATRKEIKGRARFNLDHVDLERELCRKLARFISDNRSAIAVCDPNLPENLFNRVADNWRPLFQIAEIVGGDWPKRCADALIKLTAREDDDENLRVLLLADIYRIFAGKWPEPPEGVDPVPVERAFSETVVDHLREMKERPWPEVCRGGKPITARWLARNLSAFRIAPKTLRIADERAKGYELEQFEDVFSRYLLETTLPIRYTVTNDEEREITASKSRQSSEDHPESASVTSDDNVTDTRSDVFQHKQNKTSILERDCHGVTDGKAGIQSLAHDSGDSEVGEL